MCTVESFGIVAVVVVWFWYGSCRLVLIMNLVFPIDQEIVAASLFRRILRKNILEREAKTDGWSSTRVLQHRFRNITMVKRYPSCAFATYLSTQKTRNPPHRRHNSVDLWKSTKEEPMQSRPTDFRHKCWLFSSSLLFHSTATTVSSQESTIHNTALRYIVYVHDNLPFWIYFVIVCFKLNCCQLSEQNLLFQWDVTEWMAVCLDRLSRSPFKIFPSSSFAVPAHRWHRVTLLWTWRYAYVFTQAGEGQTFSGTDR